MARWVRACGKLPARPRPGTSYSSENRPTSLPTASNRSNCANRLFAATLQSQTVGHPTGAWQKGALVRSIDLALVPADQSAFGEFVGDARDRCGHARVVGRQETHERQQEQARIHHLVAIGLREGVEPWIPTLPAHFVVGVSPKVLQAAATFAAVRERAKVAQCTVEPGPSHHFGICVVQRLRSRLPDARAPGLPDLGQTVHDASLRSLLGEA